MRFYGLLQSFFTLVIFTKVTVHSIKCYSCSYNDAERDQRCVTNPATVETNQKIISCNVDYCTSKRVEYKDKPNVVKSMNRNCEENPEQMNNIIEDDNFVTFYRACRQNLCNGDDGKGSSSGGSFDTDQGFDVVLIVQGMENSAIQLMSSSLIFILVISIQLFYT